MVLSIPWFYIPIYLIVINLIAYLMFWADKKFAQKGMWRISEHSLIVVSLLGGSIGSLIAMYTVRHKTKKLRFSVGIPIILICEIAIFVYLCYNSYVIIK